MTVTQAFTEFKNKLELTGAEQKKASDRHPSVRQTIASELDVIEEFLTGSYARDTKIRPLSDIDLFVVLHWGTYSNIYFKHSPSRILHRLKRVLEKGYTRTPIKIQSRSVNLDFSDFGFDVVPAFRNEAGFYWIPDIDRGTWIRSYPKQHANIMGEANEYCNFKLKPVIKMFKCWSRNKGDILKSFHIEVISLDIFKDGIDDSFQKALRRFFDWADFYLDYPCYDPIDSSNQIDDYLKPLARKSIKMKLQTAKAKADNALRYESRGWHKPAIWIWRGLFGHPFPTV